jgi:hypothetical protein
MKLRRGASVDPGSIPGLERDELEGDPMDANLLEHPTLEFRSRLAAPWQQVWAAATSFEGINDELRPLLRMTAPPGLRGLGMESVTLGTPLLTSTLLLGGWLPVDRMRLTLVALEAGRFVERSRLLSMSLWQHERQVRGLASGCEVTDRLWLAPRVPGTGPLLRFFVRTLFRHRHRRLQRRHGC